MKSISFTLFIIISMTLLSCGGGSETSNPDEKPPEINEPVTNRFTVNNNFILKDGSPFKVKGVVYVPGYPGFLPWELEASTNLSTALQDSILQDITDIKAMGANTIRFWGSPAYSYQALKNVGDLNFIQTIWIDGNVADFHEHSFKQDTKTYIKTVIDRIYSVYTDNNPPLIAYLIGNELSEVSIVTTNAAHPEITQFQGKYISTGDGINATEAFIAEMADYAITYEFGTYGKRSLVSYANDIRTAYYVETPFLDFRSHNAYSYAVPYYRPSTLPGSVTETYFQGWVEELKSRHPDMPLLITETGLSVSPNAYRVGAPNYGYGGNTVEDQKNGLLQNLTDIQSSSLPIAGVVIHEYLDAWWKFGLEDSYSQDPNDIEEWFGIVKFKKSGSWYSTEFRDVYFEIKQVWLE